MMLHGEYMGVMDVVVEKISLGDCAGKMISMYNCTDRYYMYNTYYLLYLSTI